MKLSSYFMNFVAVKTVRRASSRESAAQILCLDVLDVNHEFFVGWRAPLLELCHVLAYELQNQIHGEVIKCPLKRQAGEHGRYLGH